MSAGHSWHDVWKLTRWSSPSNIRVWFYRSPTIFLPECRSRQHQRGIPRWYIWAGPRVVVSAAAFHARVRDSFPGLCGLKETKMFPHPLVKLSIVGRLRVREVACSASDLHGLNFESCVWRAVSSQSSHHPQEVHQAQFSLYVHKSGLKPDPFHFIFTLKYLCINHGEQRFFFNSKQS